MAETAQDNQSLDKTPTREEIIENSPFSQEVFNLQAGKEMGSFSLGIYRNKLGRIVLADFDKFEWIIKPSTKKLTLD